MKPQNMMQNMYFVEQKDFDLFWKCHYNCRIVQRSSHDIQDLLLKMFTFNSHLRITITDIRTNKWYTQVKGCNNDKSQQSFQNIMHQIHIQSAKLQLQLKSQNMTQYQTILAPDSHQIQKTNFKFDRLRYVIIYIAFECAFFFF